MNGYDKYLEYQFHWTGSFYTDLFRLIELADEWNLAKLAKAFPEEVDAYKLWSRQGMEALAAKCSPGHPLLADLRAEGAKI